MTWLDESLANSLVYFKSYVTRILVQFWVEVITLVPFPVPSVQSVETDDRKQFQDLNIGLNNNKFDHYFWNSIDARTRFSK